MPNGHNPQKRIIVMAPEHAHSTEYQKMRNDALKAARKAALEKIHMHGKYDQRKTKTSPHRVADNETAQKMIHAYTIARAIVNNPHVSLGVPSEVRMRARMLLDKMSPELKEGMIKTKKILSHGEEEYIDFSKVTPMECQALVEEAKKLVYKKGDKISPRLRSRNIITFWDPAQRRAMDKFVSGGAITWKLIERVAKLCDCEVEKLENVKKGNAHIEDYEGAMLELQTMQNVIRHVRENAHESFAHSGESKSQIDLFESLFSSLKKELIA